MSGFQPSTGTSGTRGVSWHATRAKWEAKFWHAGKQHYLGLFAEERDAIDAVRAAREAAAENRLEEHKAGRKAEAVARRASRQCTQCLIARIPGLGHQRHARRLVGRDE